MKNNTRIPLLILMVIAIGIFAASSYKTYYVYTAETQIPIPGADANLAEIHEETELPDRLIIPSLAIDTKVTEVGVTKSGNMASPKGFKDVGWYKYGPVPGARGSAVIAGHVDNALALNGVFKRLDELKADDDLYVRDASGKEIHFKVMAVETYPYDKAPAERIFNATDGYKLNLITCAGTWNQALKTYDKRLVVYTERVTN
jgi:sortase A